MVIEAIIAFFLLWDIRKILRSSSGITSWDKKITLAMFAVVALFIIEKVVHIEKVTQWIWHLLLITIIATINFNPVFKAARGLMFAVLPFVVISLFSDLFRVLLGSDYSVIDNYVDAATVFSIIWMVAMLLITKKQRRALEKERLKTLAEEEINLKLARQKEELENIVTERTAELVQQKNELEKALVDLKATQAQLIQSEKLASLGELTAGIAHEIQNPLNFVNNFSEVNTELVDELHQAIDEGRIAEAKELANDIKENEEKIVYHGKRADLIVKSMLHHSRSSNGTKEPTDINVLADEYLRLAYHGLRAKDKSFNASMKTDFDEHIGTINIIPQDIGRVILNLITNAFHAVAEKKKQERDDYEPIVMVSTKRVSSLLEDGGKLGSPLGNGGKIEIRVKDNGNGIQDELKDKIFQPFFTTKPTGEGTGLGLSLSYDIVKAHGGELKVETTEREGSEFIITLPAK